MSAVLNFSELLLTRFCHDLAGPIGAVQNGLEFLEENISDDLNAKAMTIISDNGKELGDKLKFFRYIYGRSSSDGEVDLNTVSEIAAPYFKTKKIDFSISNGSEGMEYLQVTQRTSKLVLALSHAAVDCLITAGKIMVVVERHSGNKQICIKCSSEKFKVNEELVAILADHSRQQMKLMNVHYHLAALLAEQVGVAVKAEQTFESIDFYIEFN